FTYVYSFFYALVYGQALFFIFRGLERFSQQSKEENSKVNKIFPKNLTVFLVFLVGIVITLNGWKLINGELVNKTLFQSNNVKSVLKMDPKYEQMLTFLRKLPSTGRILTLPFTDSTYQVLHGTNNGAYVGPSTISFLTGKNDFSGYPLIFPFSDSFWGFSKEENFTMVKRILGLLNVQYIFHNADPLIYDSAFPGYPYSKDYVRKYMPPDQKGYDTYINKVANKKIYEIGSYTLYQLDNTYFLPRFYVPRNLFTYKDESTVSAFAKAKLFLTNDKVSESRVIYIDQKLCRNVNFTDMCKGNISSSIPKITFNKINNAQYRIRIEDATEPFTLVFLNQFHGHWKLIDATDTDSTFYSKMGQFF